MSSQKRKSNFSAIQFGHIVSVTVKWVEPIGFDLPFRNLMFLPSRSCSMPCATWLDPQSFSLSMCPRSQYIIIFHKGKKWSCSLCKIVQIRTMFELLFYVTQLTILETYCVMQVSKIQAKHNLLAGQRD